MKPSTTLWVVVAATVLAVAVPVLAFLAVFWDAPFSSHAVDWANFGQYVAGTVGVLLALVNIAVIVYLALAVHRLETQRERELVRPFAYLDTGDYENDVYVRLQNLGLGPMIVDRCVRYRLDDSGRRFTDLVDLMPDLGGYPWSTFSIGGLPEVIPAGGEAVLLKLEGAADTLGFPELRNRVRAALAAVVVEVAYSDMFGNRLGTVGGLLAAFAR